jgi:hypothetical protein
MEVGRMIDGQPIGRFSAQLTPSQVFLPLVWWRNARPPEDL